jgi:hypothetical protein
VGRPELVSLFALFIWRVPHPWSDLAQKTEGGPPDQKAAKSDQELFDQMTELYPHWVANQSWLIFGFPSHNPHQPSDANASSRMMEGCPRSEVFWRVAHP